MEINNFPIFTYVWTCPNYVVPTQTYYLAPIVAVEPGIQSVSEPKAFQEKSFIQRKPVRLNKICRRK